MWKNNVEVQRSGGGSTTLLQEWKNNNEEVDDDQGGLARIILQSACCKVGCYSSFFFLLIINFRKFFTRKVGNKVQVVGSLFTRLEEYCVQREDQGSLKVLGSAR
ncbi:unnamed protein product [Amoebophrya sp. A25]|nr:unnamed protein product [Amoebophrya sp. A25]|eukprot:GSA25T00027583001.1